MLAALMVWQLQRLDWKLDLIATLQERLAAEPVALPAAPDRGTMEFRSVTVEGRFTGAIGDHGFPDAAYLTTLRPHGPGYRIVQPFETVDGRTILIDRGYVPLAEKNRGGLASAPIPAADGRMILTGALRWPQEGDFFADEAAGPADNVWLTRSVDALAPLWGAEPLLVVAADPSGTGRWPLPQPVTVALKNDHLEYAITWGLLALVWAGMSAALVWRETRR